MDQRRSARPSIPWTFSWLCYYGYALIYRSGFFVGNKFPKVVCSPKSESCHPPAFTADAVAGSGVGAASATAIVTNQPSLTV